MTAAVYLGVKPLTKQNKQTDIVYSFKGFRSIVTVWLKIIFLKLKLRIVGSKLSDIVDFDLTKFSCTCILMGHYLLSPDTLKW